MSEMKEFDFSQIKKGEENTFEINIDEDVFYFNLSPSTARLLQMAMTEPNIDVTFSKITCVAFIKIPQCQYSDHIIVDYTPAVYTSVWSVYNNNRKGVLGISMQHRYSKKVHYQFYTKFQCDNVQLF